MAWEMSLGVALAPDVMAWSVLRRAVSLNPLVSAAWGGELGHLLDALGVEIAGTGRAVSEESPRIGCRSGRCLSVFYSLFAGPLAPSWSFVLVLILAFPAAVPTS